MLLVFQRNKLDFRLSIRSLGVWGLEEHVSSFWGNLASHGVEIICFCSC